MKRMLLLSFSLGMLLLSCSLPQANRSNNYTVHLTGAEIPDGTTAYLHHIGSMEDHPTMLDTAQFEAEEVAFQGAVDSPMMVTISIDDPEKREKPLIHFFLENAPIDIQTERNPAAPPILKGTYYNELLSAFQHENAASFMAGLEILEDYTELEDLSTELYDQIQQGDLSVVPFRDSVLQKVKVQRQKLDSNAISLQTKLYDYMQEEAPSIFTMEILYACGHSMPLNEMRAKYDAFPAKIKASPTGKRVLKAMDTGWYGSPG